MSGMIIAQKLYRRTGWSRTEKILQHRRQDQSQSQGIQRHQRRTESRPSTEITEFIVNTKKSHGYTAGVFYILLQKYVLVFLIEEYIPMTFDP